MERKLQIQLVLWNGSKYLETLFESLRNQTFKDWHLAILDNQSTDDTVMQVEKELNNLNQSYELIKNDTNIGFAGGHNKLLKKANTEYVLFLNQDMFLECTCLEKLINFLEKEKNITAISPRLMRWDFEKGAGEGFSDQIDTLGLKVLKSRQVVENYHAEKWPIKELEDTEFIEVFGLSGALPVYRVSEIKKVFFKDNNLYDESYNSYKEDVDLAFRLQSQGLSSAILLKAIAYHDRTASGALEKSLVATLENKNKQSKRVRYLSYRNHLATIYKNEFWQNFIIDFIWIFWYELRKFFYYLFTDPANLKGIIDLIKIKKELKNKRQEIKSNRVVDYKKIRKWWTI